jgi:hypothetical protein
LPGAADILKPGIPHRSQFHARNPTLLSRPRSLARAAPRPEPAAKGVSTTEAAAAAGVHRNTVGTWRRTHPAFARELEFAARERSMFWHDQAAALAEKAVIGRPRPQRRRWGTLSWGRVGARKPWKVSARWERDGRNFG